MYPLPGTGVPHLPGTGLLPTWDRGTPIPRTGVPPTWDWGPSTWDSSPAWDCGTPPGIPPIWYWGTPTPGTGAPPCLGLWYPHLGLRCPYAWTGVPPSGRNLGQVTGVPPERTWDQCFLISGGRGRGGRLHVATSNVRSNNCTNEQTL